MLVKDIMTGGAVSADVSDTLADAAVLMRDNDIGMLPVTRDGKLAGVITDRDITVRAVARGLDISRITAGEIMSVNTLSVTKHHRAADAAKMMSVAQFRRLPVTENGVPVGVVGLADLSRSRVYAVEAAEALFEITKERS